MPRPIHSIRTGSSALDQTVADFLIIKRTNFSPVYRQHFPRIVQMSKVTAAAIVLAISIISVAWLRPSATTRHPAHADSASVPMDVRNNRVFVPLRITGPQGTSRSAVFWVDTGGDTLVISGLLAHELG